ncbi:hypothetical protein GCM10009616_15260 [Microlunatus lacustris]
MSCGTAATKGDSGDSRLPVLLLIGRLLLRDGRLRAQVAARLPLRAAAALTLAGSRTVVGKVVLVADGSAG